MDRVVIVLMFAYVVVAIRFNQLINILISNYLADLDDLCEIHTEQKHRKKYYLLTFFLKINFKYEILSSSTRL